MAQGANTNGQSQPVYLTDLTGAYTGGGGGGGGGAVTGTTANGASGDPSPVATGGRDPAGTVRTNLADTDGAQVVRQGALPATTDRSGTATTTSGGLSVAANTNRRGLVGQNISAVNIGFNEQGGTAAIGTAGTYTVAAGSSFAISTNKLINFIAASGTAAVTMTEY